jgi:hypothetical protein
MMKEILHQRIETKADGYRWFAGHLRSGLFYILSVDHHTQAERLPLKSMPQGCWSVEQIPLAVHK